MERTELLVAKLSVAANRGYFDDVSLDLRRHGFVLLRPEDDTPEARAIVAELESLGWIAKVCDKGLVLEPPKKEAQ